MAQPVGRIVKALQPALDLAGVACGEEQDASGGSGAPALQGLLTEVEEAPVEVAAPPSRAISSAVRIAGVSIAASTAGIKPS